MAGRLSPGSAATAIRKAATATSPAVALVRVRMGGPREGGEGARRGFRVGRRRGECKRRPESWEFASRRIRSGLTIPAGPVSPSSRLATFLRHLPYHDNSRELVGRF